MAGRRLNPFILTFGEGKWAALIAAGVEHRAIMAAYVAGREEIAGELAQLAPEPGDDLASVHLHVPRSVKARWVQISRLAGLRLGDWIVRRVER